MRLALWAVWSIGALGCSPNWRNEVDVETLARPDKVIVIGAGMSGLTAAQTLHADGREVIVLEARDRIGGRTWTTDLGGADVDLGGAWIHGPKGNPVSQVMKGYGLDWEADWTDRYGVLFRDRDGEILPNSLVSGANRFARRVLNQKADHLDGGDVSVAAAAEAMLDEDGSTGQERRLRSFAINQAVIELDYSGPSDNTSLRWIDEEAWFKGGDQVPIGGYGKLVDKLAKGLDIRLSEPVEHIDWTGDAVQIRTSAETYTVSHVILTVPLGVLRAGSITFDPPLPDDKQTALHRLDTGNLEKVVLRFKSSFWKDVGSTLVYLDAEEGRHPICVDFTAHTGKPTLVCFTGGRFSRDSRNTQTDEEIVAGTLVNLAKALDRDSVPTPTHTQVTRWTTDPFAMGSYSYLPVGAKMTDLRTLSEPVGGKLLFAGEHTVPWMYQTVHGAMISGLREANRLGADPYVLPGL